MFVVIPNNKTAAVDIFMSGTATSQGGIHLEPVAEDVKHEDGEPEGAGVVGGGSCVTAGLGDQGASVLEAPGV